MSVRTKWLGSLPDHILCLYNGRMFRITCPLPLSEHLSNMEEKGLLKRGRKPLPADFWDLPRPVDVQAAVRSTVSREREEGW